MLVVSMLVMMVVIFGGLILVLRKVLSQNVSLATRHLEELNDDYAKKEADLKRQLEDVRQKSEEIIRNAQEEAQQSKAQLMKDAEAQKAKLLQETHTQAEELMRQADKSRQMLLDDIKDRIAKEAVDKACELIHDSLPEQFKLKVHEHWIEELMDSGLEQLERLKIPEDVKEVRITAAFALEENQRKNLTRKLKDALNKDITLKEEIDPRVVAGFIIHIGSLVLDGSLKNKIQERARNV
jgi:ATP synthase F1 delta subunit